MTEMRCNLCGGQRWKPMGTRATERCADCGSFVRTRVMALLLDELERPRPGDRVLHFAPEPRLTQWIVDRAGEADYAPRDLSPERYSHCEVEAFDLCRQGSELPTGQYHLIVHSHVMEHIACNWTAVLAHLHRALHPDGVHIFCIPFLSGAYDECWGVTSAEERTARFGQHDHVRRFGSDDVKATLGMVYALPEVYDLAAKFAPETLIEANIPQSAWRGYTPNTVLAMHKRDWRLG